MASYDESEKARILRYPIASLLSRLGRRTEHRGEMYYSPFRDEKEPSFHINALKNVWMDFGSGEGGNILTLVSRLEGIPLREAWDYVAALGPVGVPDVRATPPRRSESAGIVIEGVSREFTSPRLIRYAGGRGVGRPLLERYCSQVTFSFAAYPEHRRTAIGFPAGRGWVLRFPSDRERGIRATGSECSLLDGSGLPAQKAEGDSVEVFEGFFDFLSWLVLTARRTPGSDVCVLNSVNNLRRAMDFISSHGSVSLWMDDDQAGRRAEQAILSACPGAVSHSAELREAGCKDVNDLLKGRLAAVRSDTTKQHTFTIKK